MDFQSPFSVLIYGRGWIGEQFIELLKREKVEYVVGSARADDENGVRNEINLVRPTHVISLIGRTHGVVKGLDGCSKVYTTIDYLEEKGKVVENVRDNLFAPIQLAIICKEMGVHYTYLGTGCIFEYDDQHPLDGLTGFGEEDQPNFFGSSYSVVKGFTDRLMHLYHDSVLNLRIRMPITAENNPRNFITKITHYAKICSIKNSMSVLPTLLPFVIDMMKNKTTGTINLCNPGAISHNEILTLYKELVDPSFTWENFTIQEQSEILAAGRSNNYLDTSKLEYIYPQIKGIHEAVRDVLKDYKKS